MPKAATKDQNFQTCFQILPNRKFCLALLGPPLGQSLSPIISLDPKSPLEKFTVSNNSDMAEAKSMFREVLPKQGQLSVEDVTTMVLCKPRILPLKSLTLEKLEKMQQAAQDTIRQQEIAEKEQRQMTKRPVT
ncbi:BBSome-interacting protein 1 isoform X2 [Castor canadensis]